MKMTKSGLILLLLTLIAASVALMGCPPEQTEDPGMVEPPIDATPPADGDGGAINQIGSTTVLPIADAWQKAFKTAHPEITLNVSGGGSGTGIQSLIDGTADIANASREIKDEELQDAQAKGITPVEHIVAYDGIAAVVNPNVGLETLSVEQLSDIFSGEVTNWSEVGGADSEIIVVSRDSASGTYESWKEMVIQLDGEAEDRDYTPAALKQQSNEGIRSTVASTEGAIGYIGLGYLDDSVAVVKVSPLGGGEAVEPTSESVKSGAYPISRALYMYTNGEATGPIATYFEWGLGEEGQKLVAESGFVPVN